MGAYTARVVRVCFIVLALVVAALPARAQQLQLDIRDGLVTLSATNVPVRQVLAEWAKVGGTRMVGAERITGPPLTLSLEGVHEAKALDIVLRGAGGYMAVARSEPGAGRSMYDRILVLASSTPPAAGPTANVAANHPAANRVGVPPAAADRFGVPPAVEPPDAADSGTESPDAADLPQGNPFSDAFAQQGVNPFGQPAAPGIPFGQPLPRPGQPYVQGNSFFQQLPPADPEHGASLPGFVQPLQPMPAAPPPQGFFGVPG